MMINGWDFDYESLPHWQHQEEWTVQEGRMYSYVFCENKVHDIAFLVYSICEARMGWYCGFLAVLKNKQSPELFLNVTNGTFTQGKVFFSADGNFAFIKSSVPDGGLPIFIFDLPANKFACYKPKARNSCYWVEEIGGKFIIVADKWQMENDKKSGLKKLNGTEIKLKKLKWFPSQDLDSFCYDMLESLKKRYPEDYG
ncbi:MAG: hypothetical protein FWF81_04570 [Defluviitaleaceae bacterium]|nr:hypothetical protein [Defluviitaleaceae bacterium]